MESYLVFQVSTSSLLKWKLLEYLWKFYLGIWVSSPHHVFFLYLFPGQKNNEFPSSESSNHHCWSQDSRIGAHTSDAQKSLSEEISEEKVPQILRKLDFHQKMGEIFWWVFCWVEMCGVGKWRKTRSPWTFWFGEKGKDCDKRGVLETLLPAVGSNMIYLQYCIQLL